MRSISIIGSGMAGHAAASALSRRFGARVQVALFGEEGLGNLDRRALVRGLEGHAPEAAAAVDPVWYRRRGIAAHLDQGIVAIDRDRRLLRSSAGQSFAYDHVVIATGALPKLPALSGRDAPQVLTVRTWEDVELLRRGLRGPRRVAIIGGGPFGVSLAHGCVQQGASVSLIEMASSWCLRHVDRSAGNRIDAILAADGVDRLLGRQVQGIAPAPGGCRVRMQDGDERLVDLVILACGAHPRDELALTCGLRRSFDGGIRVDECLGTDDPRISALGECARFDGRLLGAPQAIAAAAEVLAGTLAGEDAIFVDPGEDMRIRLGESWCWSTGRVHGDESDEVVRWRVGDESRTLVLCGRHLVGACGFGGSQGAAAIVAGVSRRVRLWPWQIESFRRSGSVWPEDRPQSGGVLSDLAQALVPPRLALG